MRNAQQIIELYHQKAHASPNDPEDYLFFILTQQETCVFVMGAVLTALYAPCLEETIFGMEKKLAEVVRVQKPDWIQGGGEAQTS